MSTEAIMPPGDKIQKAVREFSELLEKNPTEERGKLLQKVAMKYDLTPKECDFFERHFRQE